jgi:hypothetical protein
MFSNHVFAARFPFFGNASIVPEVRLEIGWSEGQKEVSIVDLVIRQGSMSNDRSEG